MKKLVAIGLTAFFFACAALAPAAKTVADVTKCIDEHPELSPEAAAAVCIGENSEDIVQTVVALRRRKGAPVCVTYSVDAGPSSGDGPGK